MLHQMSVREKDMLNFYDTGTVTLNIFYIKKFKNVAEHPLTWENFASNF